MNVGDWSEVFDLESKGSESINNECDEVSRERYKYFKAPKYTSVPAQITCAAFPSGKEQKTLSDTVAVTSDLGWLNSGNSLPLADLRPLTLCPSLRTELQ